MKHDRSNLEEVLHLYGLDNLAQSNIKKIKESKDIEKELVTLMAERAHLGFTTRGHSGEDVFLYAYGPKKPTGLINNTDLPAKVVAHLELGSLSEFTKKRFIPAQQYYENKGYETRSERKANSGDVFIARKGTTVVEYPANQNKRKVNGREETLPGIVVFNGHTFWIPK